MITRDDFVRAVKKFEEEHGVLEECLSELNENKVRALLENPIIHSWLSRDKVDFAERSIILTDSDDPNEFDITDHHELRIYRLIPNEIIYRHDSIVQDQFYLGPTLHSPHRQPIFKILLEQFNSENINVDANFFNEQEEQIDIFTMAESIKKRDIQAHHDVLVNGSPSKKQPHFLLNANWKDKHVSPLITLIDPDSYYVLASLLMNSYKKEYYSYSKERFLEDRKITYKLPNIEEFPHIKTYLEKTFSISIDNIQDIEKSKCINEEQKSALFVNHNTFSSEFSDELNRLKSTNIETVYSITKNWLNIDYLRDIPFIDISHDLQTEAEDQNCCIYTTNFIQATTQLLSDSNVADKVCELGRIINSTDPNINAAKDEAINELTRIFTEDVKKYLPQYYNESGEKKTLDQLREYHLRQRWILGNQCLSMFYPISEENKQLLDRFNTLKDKIQTLVNLINAIGVNFDEKHTEDEIKSHETTLLEQCQSLMADHQAILEEASETLFFDDNQMPIIMALNRKKDEIMQSAEQQLQKCLKKSALEQQNLPSNPLWKMYKSLLPTSIWKQRRENQLTDFAKIYSALSVAHRDNLSLKTALNAFIPSSQKKSLWADLAKGNYGTNRNIILWSDEEKLKEFFIPFEKRIQDIRLKLDAIKNQPENIISKCLDFEIIKAFDNEFGRNPEQSAETSFTN